MRNLSILVLFFILTSSSHSFDPSPFPIVVGACKGDLAALTQQCATYVKIPGPPVPPSGACCKAIQGSDVPCICRKYITPRVEKVISMKKLVYVAAKCGRPFAHKSKCGSYTVPAMSPGGQG
ncbi:uncharacterized protein A4U43_C02F18890 [Asparagus officinalis]|uniref:Bifunctional inhibitor/plant lipid transfer protein/seed storage helical domain-containing protein n=1 Tax=Asparagus officinalis TaxID=4686 RepID=A0A5P1FJI3_ASPOF|nr:xylogen-like protein 11 [Asparagus officinalis]ONK78448.1 uncharacterized protein A4U43_C02F18890 [Asparagus officinalis]